MILFFAPYTLASSGAQAKTSFVRGLAASASRMSRGSWFMCWWARTNERRYPRASASRSSKLREKAEPADKRQLLARESDSTCGRVRGLELYRCYHHAILLVPCCTNIGHLTDVFFVPERHAALLVAE